MTSPTDITTYKTQFYLGAILFIVVVLGSIIPLFGWAVVIGGMGIICICVFTLIRPVWGLMVLVIIAAFVDYSLILQARIVFEGIPFSLTDGGAFLALLALLIHAIENRKLPDQYKSRSQFALIIVLLCILFAISAIRGWFNNNSLYDITRDIRSPLLLALSFFLTRTYVTSRSVWMRVFNLLAVGGIYGLAKVLISILLRIPTFTSYVGSRGIASGTASGEFVYILAIVLALSSQKFWGRSFLSWTLALLAVSSYIASFNLTAYFMLFIVPALWMFLASNSRRQKFIAIVFMVPILSVVLFGANIMGHIGRDGGLFGQVVSLVEQVLENISNLSSSIHFQAREFVWSEVFYRLQGFHIFFGLGIGIREIIDTGIPGIGDVLLGEPTYSYYLLGVGFVGLFALLTLQCRFVMISYRNMKNATDSYMEAIMLTFVIYGIVMIINGFLHNNFTSPMVLILYGILLGLVEAIGWLDSASIESIKFGNIHTTERSRKYGRK